MSVSDNILVGKRCVYTEVRREQRYKKGSSEESYSPEYEYVETSRKLYRGILAALVTSGQSNYVKVVVLYESGSLLVHDIENITMEDASAQPYRVDEWVQYTADPNLEKPVRRDG